jgi:hypothetical protein
MACKPLKPWVENGIGSASHVQYVFNFLPFFQAPFDTLPAPFWSRDS